MGEYIGPLVDAPVRETTKQRPYTPLQQVMPTQNMPKQAMPNAPSNAQSLELVPSQPPAGLTPKARNEFIANEANRIAAEKIKKQTQETAPPSAEFMKRAASLKDFEGFLTEYKNELDKDLMVFPKEIPILPSQGIAIPLPVGSDTARMNAKYTALLMGVKTAYELGALTGPDMGIVEAQVTNPASISGAMTSRDGMKEQVKVLEGILKRGKENLESSYGKKIDYGALKAAPNNSGGWKVVK